jgi:hypothetical protein
MARRNWDRDRRQQPVRERGPLPAAAEEGLFDEDADDYRAGGGQSRPRPKSQQQLKSEFLERQAARREAQTDNDQ